MKQAINFQCDQVIVKTARLMLGDQDVSGVVRSMRIDATVGELVRVELELAPGAVLVKTLGDVSVTRRWLTLREWWSGFVDATALPDICDRYKVVPTIPRRLRVLALRLMYRVRR